MDGDYTGQLGMRVVRASLSINYLLDVYEYFEQQASQEFEHELQWMESTLGKHNGSRAGGMMDGKRTAQASR
eukprot:1147844-Pelagomonas_calceolata.AAC.4